MLVVEYVRSIHGPFCDFPKPREANAFYAASIAYRHFVQSLTSGSLNGNMKLPLSVL